MTFKFLLSTPDKTFYNEVADSIVCPGPEGYFGVLARHARMVAAVGTGVLKVISEGNTKLFVVDGGVAEVTPESTFILADLAIPASDPADAEEKLQEIKALRTIPVILH
ncbi:MAG: F0F1 ATP synthase subunit epsilon [bacterium]